MSVRGWAARIVAGGSLNRTARLDRRPRLAHLEVAGGAGQRSASGAGWAHPYPNEPFRRSSRASGAHCMGSVGHLPHAPGGREESIGAQSRGSCAHLAARALVDSAVRSLLGVALDSLLATRRV